MRVGAVVGAGVGAVVGAGVGATVGKPVVTRLARVWVSMRVEGKARKEAKEKAR
jgi:uncharacterized membrane protein YhiD involved in acid resistance